MCLCVGLCVKCTLPSPMQAIKLMSSRRTTRPALYRAAWIVVIRGLSGGSLLPVSEEQGAEHKQSLLLCQHTEDSPLGLSFPTLSFLMLGRYWIGYTYERNCDFPHQFLKVAASEVITHIAKGWNIWNNIFFSFCNWTAPPLNYGLSYLYRSTREYQCLKNIRGSGSTLRMSVLVSWTAGRRFVVLLLRDDGADDAIVLAEMRRFLSALGQAAIVDKPRARDEFLDIMLTIRLPSTVLSSSSSILRMRKKSWCKLKRDRNHNSEKKRHRF